MKFFLLQTLVFVVVSQNSWAVKNSCKESYVPPHTQEDLITVNKWATGGAFVIFAQQANIYFDKCLYISDNPYPALFNFARVTATTCLERDLLNGYLSMSWALENIYRKISNGEYKNDSSFRDVYLRMAEEAGFDKYIHIPEDNETPTIAQSCP